MYLRVTYDQEFEDLWMHLKSKYPSKLFDLDGVGKQLDMAQFSKDFFGNKSSAADISIDSNSNVDDISVVTYNTELPKPFFRLNSYYVLWKYYKKFYGHEEANKIIEKQLIGDYYINDFHGFGGTMSYCFNYSTYDIMINGLSYINKIKSIPPKHLWSFKSQIEQFVVHAGNSTLGATGIADLFIVMSFFVDKLFKEDNIFKDEKSIWKYVREEIQSLIYTLNQPFRSNQSVFTNVSIYDNYFLDELCEYYYDLDGNKPNKDTIRKLQEMYLDIMNFELKRTPVTFPISSACFSVDENNNILDREFLKLIAKKNKEFGFINIYCGKTSTISGCCRLRSNITNEYLNSFGAGSLKVGSLGITTLNLPRMAIKANKNIDLFLELLKEHCEYVQKINFVKKHLLKNRINNGNLPLYSLDYMNIEKQYLTIGLTGINECCEIMGLDILEKDGQVFVKNMIKEINILNDKLQKRFKSSTNCEQVPKICWVHNRIINNLLLGNSL